MLYLFMLYFFIYIYIIYLYNNILKDIRVFFIFQISYNKNGYWYALFVTKLIATEELYIEINFNSFVIKNLNISLSLSLSLYIYIYIYIYIYSAR